MQSDNEMMLGLQILQQTDTQLFSVIISVHNITIGTLLVVM